MIKLRVQHGADFFAASSLRGNTQHVAHAPRWHRCVSAVRPHEVSLDVASTKRPFATLSFVTCIVIHRKAWRRQGRRRFLTRCRQVGDSSGGLIPHSEILESRLQVSNGCVCEGSASLAKLSSPPERPRPKNGSMKADVTDVPPTTISVKGKTTAPTSASADARAAKIAWRPRYYQQQAVDTFFRKAAEPDASTRRLRFHMASGTGRSFVYCLLIDRDLRTHPHGRYLIFVPLRARARRLLRELQAFGLSTCMVGDGVQSADETATVIVCTSGSARHLSSQGFRIEIFEIDERFGARVPGIVPADLRVTFADRFDDQVPVDFTYSVDQATIDGFLCDVNFSLLTLQEGTDRVKSIAQYVNDHCDDLAPMICVGQNNKMAIECAQEMQELGIGAVYLSGKNPSADREALRAGIRTGRLKAVCLFDSWVGAIDELRSIVFVGFPTSKLRLQRMFLRVSRWHSSKGIGRFIVPVSSAWTRRERSFLKHVVNSVTSMCPRYVRRIKEKLPGWFDIIRLGQPGSNLHVDEQDKHFRMQMMDQLFTVCLSHSRHDWNSRLAELEEYVANHSKLPNLNQPDIEVKRLYWWLRRNIKALSSGSLSEERERLIVRIPGVAARVAEFALPKAKRWTIVDESNCEALEQWFAEYGWMCLPTKGTKCTLQSRLYDWIRKKRRMFAAGLLPDDKVARLHRVSSMILEPIRYTTPFSDWYARLAIWLNFNKGALPRRAGDSHEEHMLAVWLKEVSKKFRLGVLNDEEIQSLSQLPALRQKVQSWTESMAWTKETHRTDDGLNNKNASHLRGEACM